MLAIVCLDVIAFDTDVVQPQSKVFRMHSIDKCKITHESTHTYTHVYYSKIHIIIIKLAICLSLRILAHIMKFKM